MLAASVDRNLPPTTPHFLDGILDSPPEQGAPSVSGNRLRILRAVRGYQRHNAASWAAVVTLGRAAGVCERTARYQLRALVRDGYLSRRDVQGQPSRFTVTQRGEAALELAPLGHCRPTPPHFAPESDHSDHTRSGARITPDGADAPDPIVGAVAVARVLRGVFGAGAAAPVLEAGLGYWLPESNEAGALPFGDVLPALPTTPPSRPIEEAPTSRVAEVPETRAASAMGSRATDERTSTIPRWGPGRSPRLGGTGAEPPICESTTWQVGITRGRAMRSGARGGVPLRSAAPFAPTPAQADIVTALALAGFPELVPPPDALAADLRAAFVRKLVGLVTRDRSLDVVLYAIGTAGRARTKVTKNNPVLYTLRTTGRVVVLPYSWGFNVNNPDELDAMRGKLFTWCDMERLRFIPASKLRWFYEPAAPAAEDAAPTAPTVPPPAPAPRPGLRAAPLPPASPEPQPGDDAHLAAVRRALRVVDPVMEKLTRVGEVADERYLNFLAGLARGKLTPDETWNTVSDTAAWRDMIDDLEGRTASKTELREIVADELRKRAEGCLGMRPQEWRAKKRAMLEARRAA